MRHINWKERRIYIFSLLFYDIMADEQQDMISEWNQQYVFDQITNELCWRGYNAQIKKDVLTWHYILEALYLHVSPILNESEKNELKNLLTVIRREMNYHMTAPKSIQTGLLGE